MKTTNNENILLTAKVFIEFEQKYLFLRRSKTDPRRPLTWDLPGGNIDSGELLPSAVIREAKEEAGIEIIDPKIIAVDHFKSNHDPSLQVIRFVYTARSNSSDVTISWEHDQYQWLSADEALEIDMPDDYKSAMKLL